MYYYYGICCREDWEYLIVKADNPIELFNNYNCQAVFDDLNNAKAYKTWLEKT
jgi:hypothetical protein